MTIAVMGSDLRLACAAFSQPTHPHSLMRNPSKVCSLARAPLSTARTHGTTTNMARWNPPSPPVLGMESRRGVLHLLLWVVMSSLLSPRLVHAKAATSAEVVEDIPTYSYKLMKIINHDPKAFTQGLEFDQKGFLVEGTGLYGKSRLFRGEINDKDRSIDIKQSIDLEAKLFGEGLTILDDIIVQTTWRENVGLVFDKETLEPKESFEYPYEGWGVTQYKGQLVTTDGTNIMRFWEIGTWKQLKSMPIIDADGAEVQFVVWKTGQGELLKIPLRLNELELIEGEVWANLWPTETIARIDPSNGQLKSFVDLRGLRAQAMQAAKTLGSGNIDVLNGIAYQAPTGASPARLVVTGKLWPLMFELDVGRLEIGPQCTPGDGDGEQVCHAGKSDEEGGKKKKKGRKKKGELSLAAPDVLEKYPEPDFGI